MKTATYTRTIVNSLGVLATGESVSLSATPASAMVFYNCTNDQLPVSLIHVPSGRTFSSETLASTAGMQWDMGRGKGYRVGINVIGPDKRFSNRDGGETVSIMKINGNTELVSGRKCEKQSSCQNTQPSGGNDGGGVAALILLGALAEALINQ